MLGRDFSAAAYAAQIEFALGPKQAALASGYRVDSEESIPQSFALGGEAYFRAVFHEGRDLGASRAPAMWKTPRR